VPRTSAIRRKADQGEGNIHITQDVVRAIRIIPGYSCAKPYKLCPKQYLCMYEHVRWMVLVVLTSDLIANFLRELTPSPVSYCHRDTHVRPYMSIKIQ
jgi:hypothetical protein